MSDVRLVLRILVERFGPNVLADAEALRSLLDDVTDEDTPPTETNLLVDAVRYRAVERLQALVENGAEPAEAVANAGGFLAAQRGATDERSAEWACETVGHALGIIPDRLEDRTEGADVTVPVTEQSHDRSLATSTTPIPLQEPLLKDRPTPRRPGHRRRASWLRPGLAAVVGVVAVIAGVSAVTTFVLRGGEPETSTTRSVPDVARTYAALGSTLTRGASDPCAVRDPEAGQSEALSCDYGDLTMSLTTYADKTQLAAHRHELVHEQARPSDVLVEQADGTYLERRLPGNGHLLYWDSTAALQSAAVTTSGGGPPLEELRAWFDARGVGHLDRTAAERQAPRRPDQPDFEPNAPDSTAVSPEVPYPFVSPELYDFGERVSEETETCVPLDAGGPTERVRCRFPEYVVLLVRPEDGLEHAREHSEQHIDGGHDHWSREGQREGRFVEYSAAISGHYHPRVYWDSHELGAWGLLKGTQDYDDETVGRAEARNFWETIS